MMMVNKGEYNGKRILGRKTIEFMAQDRLASDQNMDPKENVVFMYFIQRCDSRVTPMGQ
ncbi:hypothetical protein PMY35_16590 [Clostridium tertium]|uniref:hypothetical protein n=1 Tax=Clostridium tertium TaxID=1559 RepID=UPI00189D60DB|nr:hypothetical protein [Clostridium tertium]MDB1949431.1 hypothetical protein [Clostridium tertium]